MAWWNRRGRATEATTQQLVATGAIGGYGVDPIDGDVGFRPIGTHARAVPHWTRDKSVSYSIAAYRANPMARAIIDTYTSFCVGDSGLTLQCAHPDVRAVADRFWKDPRNRFDTQDLMLRTHLLYGESAYEMMVGPSTGIVRRSVIDPDRIIGVTLDRGNPLWPYELLIKTPDEIEPTRLRVATIDEFSELRVGEVQFFASFKALETDTRGDPFLAPVLDWLDNFDAVLSNLIDRTALARHLVYDVTLTGAEQDEIDDFIRRRGGVHVPKSGTVEVHNDKVKWDQISGEIGSYEDTNTAKSVLTNIAGGAGLAKTWLAEPEDANRATSLTMAEPVRRRVGGVQNVWLAYMTEMNRYNVDQAVAAGRLAAEVEVVDETGAPRKLRASETVQVTGPMIAAADAQVTAEMLVNLSTGLTGLVDAGILPIGAARVAARKAWEQFAGVPYRHELDAPDVETDKVADHVDANASTAATAPAAKLAAA